MASNNKWVVSTKKQSSISGHSFKQTLQDNNHRISYHRNEASNNPAVYRGGTLLQYHHPAMTPCLPMPDHSTPTAKSIQARNRAVAQNQVNHINYLKEVRKMKK